MEIAQRRCKENFEKMRKVTEDESNEKNEYFHFEFDMSSSEHRKSSYALVGNSAEVNRESGEFENSADKSKRIG